MSLKHSQVNKKLMIVESPAKAKTISKYLDGEYNVLASVGHIRDLPKSSKNAIDIEGGFIPHYEISKGKEKVVAELTRAARGAEQILLATDPDREGEAIAWHIAEALELPHSRYKRVVFHEITKDAIAEALKHPRAIDENLRRAQEARRVLDRLFGYDLSGLIWRKLRYGLSAGRVQSPALRILVDREKEIRAFIPEKFWVVTAKLQTPKKEEIIFTSSVEPKTEVEANKILEAGKKAAWQVADVVESEALRRPRPPFTTSTLQQAASSRLGLSPSMAMRHAQKLYEEGHITYMRTDSTNLGSAAINEIIAVARQTYGEKYVGAPRIYKTNSKNAQEAHEAIRPTSMARKEAGKNEGEQKLYRLIWRRAMASQMADAQTLKTKIVATTDNKEVPEFHATGTRITFDGWLAADTAARGEEVELPKVAKGEALKLLELLSEGKETSPPNRNSLAGIVKELQKRGIGGRSTYASTIKTIIDRGYVDKIQRALQPTATGEVVSDFLDKNFHDYISDTFTAQMEDELDDIASGKLEYIKSLKQFYGPFKKAVADKKDLPKISNLGVGPAGLLCPKCNAKMVWKLGKAGKFLSCERFPDCPGARTAEGVELAGPKETGDLCPDCGGNLVERDGRFGRFVACGNYPKCKYIKKDTNGSQINPNDTNVQCPICKKGMMSQKKGKYGIFYGCSNYPTCKNIIKTKPTGALCPMCSSLMMEGTKTIPDRCSNKACPMHNPHKLLK